MILKLSGNNIIIFYSKTILQQRFKTNHKKNAALARFEPAAFPQSVL